MKCAGPMRRLCIVGVGVVALSLGGCPGSPSALDPGTLDPAALASGAYWVDYQAGELSVLPLPPSDANSRSSLVVKAPSPQWFAGRGVYTLAEDSTWTRETEDDSLTLDEVLQLYDFAPPAESGTGR
jgi:hypothetical protein